MALRWVQDNIESFGGNKDKVTVIGSGAGAAIAHLLMLIPNQPSNDIDYSDAALTNNLFSRVILLSGNALSSWAFASDPVSKAEFLIKSLNCTEGGIECLQRLQFQDIRDVNMSQFETNFTPIWGPVVDGELIDTEPLAKMQTGEYLSNDVSYDYYIGVLKIDIFSLLLVRYVKYLLRVFLSLRSYFHSIHYFTAPYFAHIYR